MKRIIAILLCFVFAFCATGCSELEKEHFDKSMYTDLTGVSTFDETIKFSVDPKTFGESIIAISDKMSVFNNRAEEGETSENLDEIVNEESEEFLNEFLSEIRIALDENKMFNFEINVNGAVDYSNMYADEIMTCKFNNISVDCGKFYSRGDNVYMDKKLFYTLGSIGFIYDTELLGQYFSMLDEIIGDSKYIVIDYSSIGKELADTNINMPILNSANVLQNSQIECYEKAKEVLKDFDTGYVSIIENGTRFQIKSYDFANIGNRFASYVRQHNQSASELVNDYSSLFLGISKAVYGNEISGMEYILEDTEVTGEDIMIAMDGIKQMVNSSEFNIIFNTLNITYTNDITSVENSRNNATIIKGEYNNKEAFKFETKINITKTDEYDFADVTNINCVNFADFYEKLTEAQNNLLYGGYDLENEEVVA